MCTCQGGFGDAGCDVPLTQLTRGAKAARVIPVGGWAYFELEVPPGVQGLLVEMNRSAGDPVLVVKPAPAGFRPGGLPTVMVRRCCLSALLLTQLPCSGPWQPAELQHWPS